MTSPLEFAKRFGKLKSDLDGQPARDLHLLLLVDFWPLLEPLRDSVAHLSYIDEFKSLLRPLKTDANLHDLTLEELRRLAVTVETLGLPEDYRRVTIRIATLLACVGESGESARLLAALVGEDAPPDSELAVAEGMDELAVLEAIHERLRHSHPALCELLAAVRDAWSAERDQLWIDRARCLFVEMSDGAGGIGTVRGRMKILDGAVQAVRGGMSHEVSFDNQIKAPDDPFVGAAYEALDAVRSYWQAQGLSKKRGDGCLQARLSIPGGDHTFTGDSVGLAVALIAYAQLLKPEVLRHERFISSEVAFTGGVDTDGSLKPVSSDTLGVKVERAFFSPVKYLVLPAESAAAANECLNRLREAYPRRRLHLVAHERLSDVVEDLNIARSEKVCIGEFVARKAYKYSRATKVQIPLLAVLLYLLLNLIFPKIGLWFDWNPQYVQSREGWFEVLNADSTLLWSQLFACDDQYVTVGRALAKNIDDDAANEVLVIPQSPSTAMCEQSPQLFAYDQGHELLFVRNCAVLRGYLGDDDLARSYEVGRLDVIGVGDSAIIVTRLAAQYPARYHLRFWNARGDSLGWYVHAGYGGGAGPTFFADNADSLYFLTYNNQSKRVSLSVLDPAGSRGVSPVFPGGPDDVENLQPGNQLAYLLFPRCELSRAGNAMYQYALLVVRESLESIRVSVGTLTNEGPPLDYFLDRNLRVVDVLASDPYRHAWDSLRQQGRLPNIDRQMHVRSLRDSVLYFTDSGWVSGGQLRAAGL